MSTELKPIKIKQTHKDHQTLQKGKSVQTINHRIRAPSTVRDQGEQL